MWDTIFLWVQEVVLNKRASITKVGTDKMLADSFTKFVARKKLDYCLKCLNFEYANGTHLLALKT